MSDPRTPTAPGHREELEDTVRSGHRGDAIDDGDPQTQAMMGRLAEQLFGSSYEPVRVGRFALLDVIGSGAMGVVHLGYDDVLDRKIAIKLIRHERTASPDAHARLLREAQAMARVSHANVVPVYEAGEYPGGLFIAMEFVEGQTLRRWLDDDRPWQQTLALLLGAGRGLSAAHEQGIVHRDFKPDNVLVTRRDEAKVGDFGLAGLAEAPAVDSTTVQDSLGLTQTGTMIGTPMYMSPEQFEAKPATDRSDQFAFCVVASEALYGERPFEGDTVASLSDNIVRGAMRPTPRSSPVPAEIRAAIVRGLRPDPDERWPSMDALLAALQPPPSRRRWWVLGGLAAAALGAQVALGERPEAPCGGARAHLAGVWDDDRRAALGVAYDDGGTPVAPEGWARTAPQIDTYAEAWAQMHTHACQMTRVHQEQSPAVMELRMVCLRQAHKGLAASIALLAAPDEDVLTHAHEVVRGLPALSRCTDVELLRREGDPPAAQDADTVEEIETQVAASQAQMLAGHYEEALRYAAAATDATVRVEYGPVATGAWLALGNVQLKRQHHDEAEAALRRAQESAMQYGQWKRAVEAAALLGFTLGARKQRFAEAHLVIDLVRGLAKRTEDTTVQAKLQTRYASILTVEGRYPEAVAAYRAADRQEARRNLAITLLRWGKYDEAEVEIRGALQDTIARLGPEHPNVAIGLYTLSTIQREQGRFAEAEASLQTAIRLAEASIPGSPEIANLRQGVFSLLLEQGRNDEAIEGFRALLQTWTPILGEGTATIQAIRSNLAAVLLERGDYAEAATLMRSVLDARLEKVGPDHPAIVTARANLATVLLHQKDFEEAERQARMALALGERTLGRDNVGLASILDNLGNGMADRQRYDEAEAFYRRGLALRLEAVGADHTEVGELRNNLGTLFLERGEYEAARREFHEALRIWEASLGPTHPHRAKVLFNLGNVEAVRERCVDAIPWFERSVAIYAAGEGAPFAQSGAVFTLARCLWQTDRDRPRARTLAKQAAALLRDVPPAIGADNLRTVERFLEDTRIP